MRESGLVLAQQHTRKHDAIYTSLHYRKFCLNEPKVYSEQNDGYSNRNAVIYNRFALANGNFNLFKI